MKKHLITYSLSIFYTIFIFAQTASKDTFLFTSTPWETTDIGNGITWQHYHFKDKQLFNANENIHILRLKNRSKKAQLAFASAGDSLVLTSELARQSNALAAINGTLKGQNTEGVGVVNMPCDNKKFDHEGERKVSNILILKKK